MSGNTSNRFTPIHLEDDGAEAYEYVEIDTSSVGQAHPRLAPAADANTGRLLDGIYTCSPNTNPAIWGEGIYHLDNVQAQQMAARLGDWGPMMDSATGQAHHPEDLRTPVHDELQFARQSIENAGVSRSHDPAMVGQPANLLPLPYAHTMNGAAVLPHPAHRTMFPVSADLLHDTTNSTTLHRQTHLQQDHTNPLVNVVPGGLKPESILLTTPPIGEATLPQIPGSPLGTRSKVKKAPSRRQKKQPATRRRRRTTATGSSSPKAHSPGAGRGATAGPSEEHNDDVTYDRPGSWPHEITEEWPEETKTFWRDRNVNVAMLKKADLTDRNNRSAHRTRIRHIMMHVWMDNLHEGLWANAEFYHAQAKKLRKFVADLGLQLPPELVAAGEAAPVAAASSAAAGVSSSSTAASGTQPSTINQESTSSSPKEQQQQPPQPSPPRSPSPPYEYPGNPFEVNIDEQRVNLVRQVANNAPERLGEVFMGFARFIAEMPRVAEALRPPRRHSGGNQNELITGRRPPKQQGQGHGHSQSRQALVVEVDHGDDEGEPLDGKAIAVPEVVVTEAPAARGRRFGAVRGSSAPPAVGRTEADGYVHVLYESVEPVAGQKGDDMFFPEELEVTRFGSTQKMHASGENNQRSKNTRASGLNQTENDKIRAETTGKGKGKAAGEWEAPYQIIEQPRTPSDSEWMLATGWTPELARTSYRQEHCRSENARGGSSLSQMGAQAGRITENSFANEPPTAPVTAAGVSAMSESLIDMSTGLFDVDYLYPNAPLDEATGSMENIDTLDPFGLVASDLSIPWDEWTAGIVDGDGDGGGDSDGDGEP